MKNVRMCMWRFFKGTPARFDSRELENSVLRSNKLVMAYFTLAEQVIVTALRATCFRSRAHRHRFVAR
jgi:hypothetical protein